MEIMDLLSVSCGTVRRWSKKLGVGEKNGIYVYYTENEYRLLKKHIHNTIAVLSDDGIMATVNLAGHCVIIDSNDLNKITDKTWVYRGEKGFGTYIKCENGYKYTYLHRLLLGEPDGLCVDHINHDKLDNRKCNLRVCTRSENLCNKILSDKNTSGYKGVCYVKDKKKWQAVIGKSCNNCVGCEAYDESVINGIEKGCDSWVWNGGSK